MNLTRTITRNVLWNWTGVSADAIVGFLLTPILILRLGSDTYGLWILIGSLTSYFGLLDLGLRGSIGRFIAFHVAERDQHKVNQVLSTALALTGIAGLVALLAIIAVRPVFFRIFEVPTAEVEAAHLALLLVGINLALTLPLRTFDATLWGLQRFDLLNMIDIPATLLRGGLCWYAVTAGGGLVHLAWIMLLVTILVGAAKVVGSFSVESQLRLGASSVQVRAMHALVGYGIWNCIRSIANMTSDKFVPFIIGATLGVGIVAPYAIAMRLITYANLAIVSATGVMTPVAATLQAQANYARQLRLFVDGTRYCTSMALFFFALFTCLGRALLQLWVGEEFAAAWLLLILLSGGELFAMSQCVTQSVLLGMASHRLLSGLRIVETLAVIALGVALINGFGLTGLCVAVALPAAIMRGLAVMVWGCRVLRLDLRTYVWNALLPPLAAASLPAAGLGMLVSFSEPRSWAELCVAGFVFTAVYAACVLSVLGLPGRIWWRPLMPVHLSTVNEGANGT